MADAMHEAMLDARQEGGSYRRIEVITGQRRRRQWTAEEKARIGPLPRDGRGQCPSERSRRGVVAYRPKRHRQHLDQLSARHAEHGRSIGPAWISPSWKITQAFFA